METQITDETLKAIREIENKVIPKKEKRKQKLPVYLSEEEFKKLITVTKQEHHQLAYKLGYGSGLRISEIINLQPEDIDLKTKRIHIKNAKGGKDRICPLPKGFPVSSLKLIPLKCDIRALQIAFHNHVVKAGIFKEGLVFHSLRHSFAVRCQDKGIPLNVIQQLLGHENISTTSIYTKINPSDALKKYEELW